MNGVLTEVEYRILWSSTYQVPVLYFHFSVPPLDGVSGMEAVYKYIVPEAYRSMVGEHGVLGAISSGVGLLPMNSENVCLM